MTRPAAPVIGVLASPQSWYLRDLIRAAADRYRIVPLAFSHVASRIAFPAPTSPAPTSPAPATPLRLQVDSRTDAETPPLALTELHSVLVRTMPPGSLEQVVFRMDALGQVERQGVRVLNNARAIEAAVDKFLTTAKLAAEGLPVPPTIACQTTRDALEAFAGLGGDVVVKPLFGGEGRGIIRLEDESMAYRAFRCLEQLQAVIYLQPFIPHHGYDLRLFVLGETVWGMKRSNPCDWRTNVSRGATTEPIAVDRGQREVALRAARSVGAAVAGVDLLPARDGTQYVLEVNAVPGWQRLSKTLQIDVAARVLDFLQSDDSRADT